MFDPSSLTLGEVSAIARNLAIIAILARVAWKARGFYDSTIQFMDAVKEHMSEMGEFADDMREFTTTVTGNHLKHMEADLKTLAGRKTDDVD